MSKSEKPNPPNSGSTPPQPPRRSPKAGLVWLVIMIVLGAMLLFKNFGSEQQKELNQTEFETLLNKK